MVLPTSLNLKIGADHPWRIYISVQADGVNKGARGTRKCVMKIEGQFFPEGPSRAVFNDQSESVNPARTALITVIWNKRYTYAFVLQCLQDYHISVGDSRDN